MMREYYARRSTSSSDSSDTLGPKDNSHDHDIDAEQPPTKKRRITRSDSLEERMRFKPIRSSSNVNLSHYVQVETQRYPNSLYLDNAADVSEKSALQTFVREWNVSKRALIDNAAPKDEFVTVEVVEFAIYRPQKLSGAGWWTSMQGVHRSDFELISLHELKTRFGVHELLIDGVFRLKGGKTKRKLQAVRFETLSVYGYDDDSSPAVSIWIQSRLAGQHKVWYHLVSPAPGYERYWRPFLWIANFAKHFVDYASDKYEKGEKSLQCLQFKHLRSEFLQWLRQRYRDGGSIELEQWVQAYGRQDFRHAFVAYTGYLWNEISSLDKNLTDLQIWKEADPENLRAITPQSKAESLTIVTPFVADCFMDMYFASSYQAVSPAEHVLQTQRIRMKQMGFLEHDSLKAHKKVQPNRLPRSNVLNVGDVVCIPRDAESKWRDTADVWFAYIQDIRDHKGQTILDVLWLYRPQDTVLGDMRYPFPQELFFSDHCNCNERNFDALDVVGVLDVEWFPKKRIPKKAFIRQQYCTEDSSFSTLTRVADFMCEHKQIAVSVYEKIKKEYQLFDTVLVLPPKGKDDELLEPMIIDGFDDEHRRIMCRALLRRTSVASDASSVRPNDLVWTDVIMSMAPGSIERRCRIRFYTAGESMPAPYDRKGQGDAFFISSRLVEGENIVTEFVGDLPTRINLGFDPDAAPVRKPLAGLSLFSGGGNFDFGLEEGGQIRVDHHVEWEPVAAHTIRVNSEHETNIWLGSVDHFMAAALRGDNSVAGIGDVSFIVGGSPCQGFSMLQIDNQSFESKRNASKVATMAAFIDLYRPAYALLENVTSMSRKINGQNVFSQMLCTLVGMGYQVRHFQLNAWNYGDATTRTRLFIAATAPGLVQPEHPPQTHDHYTGFFERSLGQGTNGEKFGVTRWDPTPFRFLTARGATSDLPDISDGHVRACIPFPDHRITVSLNPVQRLLIQSTPRWPERMNIAKVMYDPALRTLTPQPVIDYFSGQTGLRQLKVSKSWTRIAGSGPIPTIVTRITPADAKAGTSVHWDQQRLLSLQEARRAQGYPDDMVLLGTPVQQWKIVGNSVARGMALALGLSFREAWLACSEEAVKRATTKPDVPIIHSATATKKKKTKTETRIEKTKRVVEETEVDDLARRVTTKTRVEVVVITTKSTVDVSSTDMDESSTERGSSIATVKQQPI